MLCNAPLFLVLRKLNLKRQLIDAKETVDTSHNKCWRTSHPCEYQFDVVIRFGHKIYIPALNFL